MTPKLVHSPFKSTPKLNQKATTQICLARQYCLETFWISVGVDLEGGWANFDGKILINQDPSTPTTSILCGGTVGHCPSLLNLGLRRRRWPLPGNATTPALEEPARTKFEERKWVKSTWVKRMFAIVEQN